MTHTTPNATPSDGPTPQDMALAEVKGSRLFGVTNTAGKVLTAIEGGALGMSTIGMAQTFLGAGAVAGLTLSLPVSIAFAAASVGLGVGAYWLGNFDDKRIGEYNEGPNAYVREHHTAIDQDDMSGARDAFGGLLRTGMSAARRLSANRTGGSNFFIPVAVNDTHGSSGSWGNGESSSSSSSKKGDLSKMFSDLGKGGGQALVIGAAVAAAVASYATFGAAVWKNFISKAPDVNTSRFAHAARGFKPA